jgi:hypothetical protein
MCFNLNCTGCQYQVVSILASCSLGPRFTSQPENRLSWLTYFVVFLRLSRQRPWIIIKLGHDLILPCHLQLFINHPVLQHYIVWDTDCIVMSMSTSGVSVQGNPCTAAIFWSVVHFPALSILPVVQYILQGTVCCLTESYHGHLVPWNFNLSNEFLIQLNSHTHRGHVRLYRL